jgi:cytochrome P450
MLATEHRTLEHHRRRYGDVFTVNMWPFERLVVVADPAEVKRIFTGDPHTLHAGEGNKILEPILGSQSVLVLDGDAHLRRRKQMLPAFHGERMRLYGDLMRETADAEIDTWPLDQPFAIKDPMQRITLRVIMRAVFGMEGERGERLERHLVSMLDNGQGAAMVPFLQHSFGGHGPWAQAERAALAVDELIYDELARRRAGEGGGDDILSMLLEARDSEGEPLGDEELRDQLVTLLVAGHETTATAMSWAVERVLRHPHVLARVREEIADGGDAYLDCVIKETLRDRPVLNFVMRTLKAPMEVGGYTVPAGWTLGTSILLLHRRPDLFPDPYAFRPERFEERPPETYTWIPFGGGVRRCLGAAFAGFEMKQVLSRVFGRCVLEPADARSERPSRRMITYVPAKGGRVILRARSSEAEAPAAESARIAARV